MKIYDKSNKRLIVLQKKADPTFWDIHWKKEKIADNVTKVKTNKFIKKFTTKYLKPGAKILEGGCGIGQNVYALQKWGYDAYGVDFAETTIKKVKQIFPELKLDIQDVRELNFPDNFFDGYWSLGVIEHFWDGYEDILTEAKRVIKNGGYFFLSFPHISLLRKLKIRIGFYRTYANDIDKESFYEFILSENKVKEDVENNGFRLMAKYSYSTVKGIKDESLFLARPLQKIYDSQNLFAKGIGFLIEILFPKIASHMALLIFQKNEK